MLFPTGKAHVSYSEVKLWKECSYRHKLTYIDKLQAYEDNPYADFGTAIHTAIENYLLTRTMDLEKCLQELRSVWSKKGYDSVEYIEKRVSEGHVKNEPLEIWEDYARVIIAQFPTWLENEFPEWEIVSAECQLYEPIDGEDISFKGFVDCLIKVKDKKGKELLWVIDWKTTGPGGWFYKKKQNFLFLAQVGLYKKYISKKLNIPLKDIRCGYVFLKRGAKPTKCIELFNVSVGPKFVEKADKMVDSMIKSVKNGMTLKNFNSCRYCPFANSEHCNGQNW